MVTLRDVPDRRDVILGLTTRVPAYVVRCPECHWPLGIDEEVEAFHPLTGETRTVAALALCGNCGFTHELRDVPPPR
jgi:hypothetical protein